MIPLADSYFSDMPQIAKQFLNYLGTIKGRSVRTVDGYHIDLRTFLRFMKLYKSGIKLSGITDDVMQNTDITDLDLNFLSDVKTSDIYEFMQYTMQGRNNNAATRSRKTTCIRTFYKYLSLHIDHPIKKFRK